MLPVIGLILLLFIFKNSIYYYFSGEISNSNPFPLSVALSSYKSVLAMFIVACALNIYLMAAFPYVIVSFLMECLTNLIMVGKVVIAISIVIAILVVILFIVLFSRSHKYRLHYVALSVFFLGLMGLIAYEHGALFIHYLLVAFITRYYYISTMIVVMMLSLMADELLDIFSKISK